MWSADWQATALVGMVWRFAAGNLAQNGSCRPGGKSAELDLLAQCSLFSLRRPDLSIGDMLPERTFLVAFVHICRYHMMSSLTM